jgi:hypothetical protein
MLMGDGPRKDLPIVLATSVIRSTHQGESHGGTYLIDLSTGEQDQVLDWNDRTISWEGRGADRGLRGIAFHRGQVFIAASDELFVFDQSFNIVDSFRNQYLSQCHEIHRDGDTLWLTSTGFDAVLAFDLTAGRFATGLHVVRSYSGRLVRKLNLLPRYSVVKFDPSGTDGPPSRDRLHINNVWADQGRVTVSGTGCRHILDVTQGAIRPVVQVPFGTHNAQPYGTGFLHNHTPGNEIAYLNDHGRLMKSYPIIRYDDSELLNGSLPEDHARQAFGRGLCTSEAGLLIGGSSPATVSVFDIGTGARLANTNLTKDVRNSIHGLELWPF